MDGTEQILVSALASADAVWTPQRAWDVGNVDVRPELKKQYHVQGIPLLTQRTTRSERESTIRSLNRLAASGMLTLSKPGGSRDVLFSLAYRGERRARWLADPGWELDCYRRLLQIAEVAASDDAQSTDGKKWWASELRLIDEPRERIDVQFHLSPARLRGWVSFGATARGEVRYQLLPAGEQAIEAGPPDGDASSFSIESYDFYLERWAEALTSIKSMKCKPGEIGEIPLPISMAPRAYWEEKLND